MNLPIFYIIQYRKHSHWFFCWECNFFKSTLWVTKITLEESLSRNIWNIPVMYQITIKCERNSYKPQSKIQMWSETCPNIKKYKKLTLPYTVAHQILLKSSTTLVILTETSFWVLQVHNLLLVSYLVSLFTLHKST